MPHAKAPSAVLRGPPMTPLVHSSLARHEVLLVEDNEDHALLVAAALRKSKRCKLVTAGMEVGGRWEETAYEFLLGLA